MLAGALIAMAGAVAGIVVAGGGDGGRQARPVAGARGQAAGTPPATGSPTTPATTPAAAPTGTSPAAGPATTGAPTPASGSYRGAVPILMYHVITAPKPGTALPGLWVPQETFRATITLLADRGYRGVTLEQVWAAWHGGAGLPAKPVVVSFDDGYLSHWTHARPALRAAGWPGVLNLEAKNVGPGGLSKRQVRDLIAAGWEIGSHTLTHPDLTAIGADELRHELVGSRQYLADTFGVDVDFLCYPAGTNNAAVRAATKAAGYLAATTVEPGIASKQDDPFGLPRVRVNGSDSPQVVLAELQR